MHVAIIGGASTIGSTLAYALASYRQDIDITLVDIDADAAAGHATGLTHGAYHLAHAPGGTESAVKNPGTVNAIHSNDIGEIAPDLAVVTAGGPHPDEDDLDRDFRDTRVDPIADMLDDIARQLQTIGPLPVINVTNPLDRVTYYLWKRLGWERELVFGYSLSESARAADAVGQVVDVHPNRVHCPVMGEHGEHAVVIFSRARVDGEPVSLSEDDRQWIRDYVQDIPIKIAKQRGLADSSRWVTSAGIRRVIEIVHAGGSDDRLCLTVPLDGEYGYEDGCLSIPVTLGTEGIIETFEWELENGEADRLDAAHRAISETLPDVGLL